ncbi:Alanine--tRNA ligase [Morella rubra]|uniref:Alanine--tRNA ligase n=1 Tax=Morella rubra TaxID=262757 RepID=A0A6A1V0D6_9ROSI|nr:Alanine--tRNA ligase [Morella rubra]
MALDGTVDGLSIPNGVGRSYYVPSMSKMSNYDIDIFMPIFDVIQQATVAQSYSGKVGPYDLDRVDMAFRVVADHIRTLSFAIADGSCPGEVREKPKESKEYNNKTFRLMGFMQNEDGEWYLGMFMERSGKCMDISRCRGNVGKMYGPRDVWNEQFENYNGKARNTLEMKVEKQTSQEHLKMVKIRDGHLRNHKGKARSTSGTPQRSEMVKRKHTSEHLEIVVIQMELGK